MSILPQSAYDIQLPKMIKVTQNFLDEKLSASEIKHSVKEQILNVSDSIKPGQTAALLVGSRGISQLDVIVKAAVATLIELGIKPFIVPSMGSHGGGIAEKQKEIIEAYNITEKDLGIPIVSSLDTVIVGETLEGVPVHVSKDALEADLVIPVARIKIHTDFDGPIESGLCKMLSIGIGKHNGCSRLHMEGFASFSKLIPQAAEIVLRSVYVPFGIGIVENAYENVHTIKILRGSEIIEKEPGLLRLSKELMPKLQFAKMDVLIIEQIGKDISGAGMDPKIVGRVNPSIMKDYKGPEIGRIIILGLSKNAHNNATGLGLGDYITRSTFNEIDFGATYTNCIAAGQPEAGRTPIVMETEEEALRAAIMTCPKIDLNDAKIVRIKDTLHLGDIWVSENMLPLCSDKSKFKIHNV